MLYISALAAGIGAVATVAAWALLKLIGLSTNLFYFHHFSAVDRDPFALPLHWWSVFLPVLGGLLVGLIARFGSPRVRGHGMPEAVEVIVFGRGRVQPRLAILKPVATAIAIGSGGPFGAEGPVIMTGGALGSLLGQLLPMTDSERTTLMVSGAAAGMAATFSCPMSAVLLAVELLLFEWRPRSLVPVAIACVTGGALRRLLLGSGPIFPMPPTTVAMHHSAMLGALVVGGVAAFLAIGLSKGIHFFEHLFERIPIHWMWYPALGGVVVGLGGLIFPQALGVGYSVIQLLVNGNVTWKLLAGILVVKSLIWMCSLGSNTAGGILAPMIMIGGAMGLALGHFLPFISPGAWAVVGMTAILAAALGAPLTAAMLAVELTHNGGLMLPVLLACVTAYAVGVLVQPRSMLTANLSRRGLHLTREYGVDPLELVMVAAAMHKDTVTFPAAATRKDAQAWLDGMNAAGPQAWSDWQRIFPLVDEAGTLAGMLTRGQLMQEAWKAAEGDSPGTPLLGAALVQPVTMSSTETLRQAAMEMADSRHTAFPVLDAAARYAGILTITDLLTARTLAETRESERSRVLHLRWRYARKQQVSAQQVSEQQQQVSEAEEVKTKPKP